jgi:hypothetical protein
MTIRGAVTSALAEAGAATSERTVDEVLHKIPVDATVADVIAADVGYGMTVLEVIAAIRSECRIRASGQPSQPRPRGAPPAPVEPLAPPPPAAVGLRGLAAVRAVLEAAQRDDSLDRS